MSGSKLLSAIIVRVRSSYTACNIIMGVIMQSEFKNEVLSELMEEHVRLKKDLGES